MKEEATEKSRCGYSRRNVLMASVAAGAALLVGLPKGAPGGEATGTPADAPEYAVDRFIKSMNCSQAVLETYAPSMGMPEDIARRVAAAFAGGMGMGSECGAVTGAFLVIGMKYGKTKDKDRGADEKTFSKVAEFIKEFKARHEHLGCSELLGVDMSTAEGVRQAAGKGLFTGTCPKFVRSASEILDKLLA